MIGNPIVQNFYSYGLPGGCDPGATPVDTGQLLTEILAQINSNQLELQLQLSILSQQLEVLTTQFIQERQELMTDFSAIQAALTQEESVEMAVIALLEKLAADINANQADPAAIAAIAAQIKADSLNLAQAIIANTPVGPQQSL